MKKETERKDACDMLVQRWKDFNMKLFADFEMDINEFKSLFKDTWRYFSDAEDKEKMYIYDAELMSEMTPVTYLKQYPDGVGENQCQVAIRFVSEFLINLGNPQNYYGTYDFRKGWIAFRPYNDCCEQYIYIDDFEKEFENLCDEYDEVI